LLQLEAADFIAYEAYREVDNCILDLYKVNKKGEPFGRRIALARLMQDDLREFANVDYRNKPVPHYMFYADAEVTTAYIKALDHRFPVGWEERWNSYLRRKAPKRWQEL
jgi:hypothetical protein